MNQQAARTECNQVRAEALDNLVICDDERDRVLALQETKFIGMMRATELGLEERLHVHINQKIKEELVLLRQWATNLTREKVTEECRALRNWTNKEIRETREIFNVPGIIGSTQPNKTITSSPVESPKSALDSSQKSTQHFENFAEFVRGVLSSEAANDERDARAAENLAKLNKSIAELDNLGDKR